MVDDVIERVEEEGDDPEARLRRLFAIRHLGSGAAQGRTRDPRLGQARQGGRQARQAGRQPPHDYMRSLFVPICRDEDEPRHAPCWLLLFIGSPLHYG